MNLKAEGNLPYLSSGQSSWVSKTIFLAFFLPDPKTPSGAVMRVAENQYPHNLHPNPGHESYRATVLNSNTNNTIRDPNYRD